MLFLIFLAQLYWQHSGFIRASIYLLIGIAWGALIGLAYRRHLAIQVTHYKFIPLLAFITLCGWAVQAPQPLNNNQNTKPVVVWSQADWQTQYWQTLPRLREDLRQSQQYPFNLQWRGNEVAIKRQLEAIGWRTGAGFSWLSILKSLQASPRDTDLPLLPHLHHGKYESLRWVKYANDKLYVIRLWQSPIFIEDKQSRSPLWFGNIAIQAQHSQLGWHYLRTTTQFTQALDKLRNEPLKFIDKDRVLLLDSANR
jgi:undecaprenyl-diphosphatase